MVGHHSDISDIVPKMLFVDKNTFHFLMLLRENMLLGKIN